jgi:hypothetical protein
MFQKYKCTKDGPAFELRHASQPCIVQSLYCMIKGFTFRLKIFGLRQCHAIPSNLLQQRMPPANPIVNNIVSNFLITFIP